MIPIDAKLDMLVAEDLEQNEEKLADTKALLKPDDNIENDNDNNNDEEEEPLHLSDVFKLPYIFKILTLSVILIYGCIVPFNNIASTLFLERDYFQTPPDECHLMLPNQCENSTNVPVDCPSSAHYQPPLPVNITYNGVYYSELSSSDIDCSDDQWKDVSGGTQVGRGLHCVIIWTIS
jgi:hypothetical protein